MPLESIKPSSILPVTVYDQHGFRVLFHFARDPLPGRSDVLVVVVSMLSTAPQPIRNIVFQSAVPKVMKVRLQPPSGTELPAFNPIVHPSAITQVLLLANPQKEKVRLRYKLIFTMGDQTYNEMGDVDQFPPPETWGASRTEGLERGGAAGPGPVHPVLLSLLWPPVTLPLPLPLLSQTQQEAAPGSAIAAGTSITSGSLEQGGAVCPGRTLG